MSSSSKTTGVGEPRHCSNADEDLATTPHTWLQLAHFSFVHARQVALVVCEVAPLFGKQQGHLDECRFGVTACTVVKLVMSQAETYRLTGPKTLFSQASWHWASIVH